MNGETPATTGATARDQHELEIAAETPSYSIRRLVRGAGLYSISDITLKTLGFFLVPLYTSVLTPTDYGIVGFAQAVIQILSPLVGLSLIGALPVLFYAYEDEERRRLISTVVNFMLLSGLVTTLALILFSQPVFDEIAPDVAFHPYVLLALVTIFVTTMEFIPLNIFNMRDQPGRYSIYALSLGLLGVGLNITLVVGLDLGAEGVLISGMAAGTIGMVAAGFVVKRYWRPVIEGRKLREIFHIALPALPNAFSGVIARYADRLFLAGTVSLATTGIYSLAVTFSSVALMVLGGITTALNPLFYRRAYADDETLKDDWSRLSSLFLFAALMVGLTLALVGADMIEVLTPESYHEATAFMPLLVLGQVFLSVYWLFSPAIGFRRKMWAFPVASFTAMAVNLTGNAILVPEHGGTGAAIALVLSGAVQLAIFGGISQHYFPISYEKRQILKLLIAAAIAFVLGSIVDEPLALSLGIEIAIILAVPVALLASGFFSPVEVDAGRRALKQTAATVRGWRSGAA